MTVAHLPPLDDLRPLRAEMLRARRPLLLLVSSPGCPYCLLVRRSYLVPRLRLARGPILRELDLVGGPAVIGLDGRPSSAAAFAARYGAKMTPVVLLLGPDLALLAEPLIGVPSADFYEGYLQARIDEATRKLAGQAG